MKSLVLSLIASASLLRLVVGNDHPVTSTEYDLLYDENGRLAKHYLVYPSGNPNCPAESFVVPTGFEKRALVGNSIVKIFPGYQADSGDCPVACIERGTDKTLASHIMPHKKNLDASSTDELRDWFENKCRSTEVCVMNYHDREHPLKLMWVDDAGNERLHLELFYGEPKTRCFNSFIGHKFIARDGVTGNKVHEFTVEYILSMGIGQSPPSGNPEGFDFDDEIQKTLMQEWDKQSKIERTFSPLGFKKARLPDDVFASMGSFYYNNRKNNVNEEWDGKGVFVNWWETDCSFIQVPWATKMIWQERLRLLVEEWAGVPIEQTDMYGLRQYEPGARLLTHVDRETTHAVSLIVNIAQGNLAEPWPVEVFDHAHRLHEVIMEPGDIVYYESAKALHSRNRPLAGEHAYYVNLFTHYRPVGDPDWMYKPNKPGTPEPLIEVKGECKLTTIGMKELPNKQLGMVQAVKCDDPRLGNTVSPTLFTANSGEDLVEWWRYTGDSKYRTSKAAYQ